MGLDEDYPWSTDEEFIEYALAPSGLTLADYQQDPVRIVGTHEYRKYETAAYARW